MKSLPLARYLPDVSSIAFGCMGLGGGWNDNPVSANDLKQGHLAIDTAIECGINFFDHADIYTLGKAEQVFGELLRQRPSLRENLYLQSKCAIRFQDENNPGRYDHSKEWINLSVDNILKRLNTDYIDILLLHRPDPLMDVEEVAETLEQLKKSGKVNHCGVSNMHRFQMELLNHYLSAPIVVNQLEMSLSNLGFLEQGVTVAMDENAHVGFDAGTTEYCQMNGIQVQSWGSLSQGLFTGKELTGQAEHTVATAKLVSELSDKYHVSREAIVLAWLMKMPYSVQPVIGTINPERIKHCEQANKASQLITREDWYKLYVSARGKPLP